MTAMHAEGRRYVERVQRDRVWREEAEIMGVRIAWDRLTDRERAIVLATHYDDVEIPAEPRKSWWRR